MSEPAIHRLSPLPSQTELTDDDITALYREGTGDPWLRVNFVSSADGAATHQGLSGGLSNDVDSRVFELLRRLCDVVLVGAGTVRAEGYGAMRVAPESARARSGAGMTAHPVFAIVSAGLDLDPRSSIFQDAPERPIILTTELSRPEARETLSEVADVVVCGRERVQAERGLRVLHERGLTRIHCEGGPHLFADLIAARAVDELCLTLSPRLEGGTSSRIATGAAPIAPLGLRLAHTLAGDDTLLLRYVRG
ncbi:pyrimidine reductase family protein [Leifsonia sp. 1010]|uniref:pyrimidine reductase family protein n=1 Tax=Leifsonia sp. 1010 TaxID=2817769 RepID=UPI00286760F1|nr:pyrimidine reductase family protein [Leifsonia sp. 1010]MDR6613840.1 riboflavin biosynthesis pyrimidine reductase [Leifsonia sp. 1010]